MQGFSGSLQSLLDRLLSPVHVSYLSSIWTDVGGLPCSLTSSVTSRVSASFQVTSGSQTWVWRWRGRGLSVLAQLALRVFEERTKPPVSLPAPCHMSRDQRVM